MNVTVDILKKKKKKVPIFPVLEALPVVEISSILSTRSIIAIDITSKRF